MRLILISHHPVTSLFGMEFPFAGIDCITRESFFVDDLETSDCIIDLTIEDRPQLIKQYKTATIPVLIGSAVLTLKDLGIDVNLPIARFNHWPTFIDRNCIEFAVVNDHVEKFQQLFQLFNFPAFRTADDPGFVSAKIVSMIINEAFLSKEEKVSTANEIDIAMKLGTNYPMGPFEWCSKIGADRIYRLLQKLAEKEDRYQPASSFIQTVQN